jgi:molybdate transport system permease protein
MMVAGNIPDSTQTLSVAIYDAVEAGNGAVARMLVIAISALAILLVWASGSVSRYSRAGGLQ